MGVLRWHPRLVENDGVDIDDFVFGKIVFKIEVINGYVNQMIEIYPHPVTSKKFSYSNNMVWFDRKGYPSKPSSYFLFCSLPFKAALKLDYFQSSGDFCYRSELM